MSAALKKTIDLLLANDKGILAADESDETIKKRFDQVGIENTVENRRRYRELLFTTKGISDFISGVIMFDETIKQQDSSGVNFPQFLEKSGILPGVKVDKGKEFMQGSDKEFVTNGMWGLTERLIEYKKLGAKFAKWRAVFVVGENLPSSEAIEINADLLASYALACQENDIVPIVEPEVLMDGNHDIDESKRATYRVLKGVFLKLSEKRVDLKSILLKPNMVIQGLERSKAAHTVVASHTMEVLLEVVPDTVPGIVFLSGGQSPEEATVNLNEVNKSTIKPWKLSFSYGRALQENALRSWRGENENFQIAQSEFLKRAKLNSLAVQGRYSVDLEAKSLEEILSL